MKVEAATHAGPDALQREGLASRRAATWRVDLPAAVYGLMFVMGDAAEETWPRLALAGHGAWRPATPIVAGRRATPVLSVALEREGPVEITFESSDPARYRWTCCGLFIRRL